jgi:hypothetical protein
VAATQSSTRRRWRCPAEELSKRHGPPERQHLSPYDVVFLEPAECAGRPTCVRRPLVILALMIVLGSGAACDADGPGPTTGPTTRPTTGRTDGAEDPGTSAAGEVDSAGNGGAAPFKTFARGGPAPAFDDQVDVSIGAEVVLSLSREVARDPQSWTDASGSLLRPAADARVRTPRSCSGLPSPVGPPLEHEVEVSGMAVLWRQRACDFAVRLLIDSDGEIAAVAIDDRE